MAAAPRTPRSPSPARPRPARSRHARSRANDRVGPARTAGAQPTPRATTRPRPGPARRRRARTTPTRSDLARRPPRARAAGARGTPPAARPRDRSTPRSGEEAEQLAGGLARPLLREEVAAIQCPAPEIGRASSPDPVDVVGAADPGRAPQNERRTRQRLLGVGSVVLEVDGRPGAVVLACGMDRRRVEAA